MLLYEWQRQTGKDLPPSIGRNGHDLPPRGLRSAHSRRRIVFIAAPRGELAVKPAASFAARGGLSSFRANSLRPPQPTAAADRRSRPPCHPLAMEKPPPRSKANGMMRRCVPCV